MNIEIFAVNAALLAILLLPYYLIFIVGNNGYAKLTKRFKQEIIKNNLKPDQQQSWNSNLVGLDREQQKLLFVQSRKDEMIVELFDLNFVKQSMLIEVRKPLRVNERTENLLQRIYLEMTPVYGEDKKTLNLYDADHSYYEDYELENAKKLNEVINKSLKFNPVISKVA